MAAVLALAGDTMLGRGVGEALRIDPSTPLIASEVAERIAAADAFVLNLECCVSERGARFADPDKPFFFRAPPLAAQRLAEMGVTAVTLANNHALDYGPVALIDTLAHLEAAGVVAVGAGATESLAREPRVIACGDLRVRLVGFSDQPAVYAAGPAQPGIAFADLRSGLPDWVRDNVSGGPEADAVLVTPHWGPNMVARPGARILRAAEELIRAGATLVAGHSAHVFQAAAHRVLFDLGDFLDDYAVNQALRNDLGLLWLVELDSTGPSRILAFPLSLDYCFTRQASARETQWIFDRLAELCAPFNTKAQRLGDGMIELSTSGEIEA